MAGWQHWSWWQARPIRAGLFWGLAVATPISGAILAWPAAPATDDWGGPEPIPTILSQSVKPHQTASATPTPPGSASPAPEPVVRTTATDRCCTRPAITPTPLPHTAPTVDATADTIPDGWTASPTPTPTPTPVTPTPLPELWWDETPVYTDAICSRLRVDYWALSVEGDLVRCTVTGGAADGQTESRWLITDLPTEETPTP